jgi:hypothetical protein
MDPLVEVLTDHFVAHRQQVEATAAAAAAADAGGDDGDEGRAPDVTRAMVFITYREQVNLVWQHLKQLEPEIICRCVWVVSCVAWGLCGY